MISIGDLLFAVEPNHGELDLVIRAAAASSALPIFPPRKGISFPLSLVAFHRGNFYVGNLGVFPITAGSSKILKISPLLDT